MPVHFAAPAHFRAAAFDGGSGDDGHASDVGGGKRGRPAKAVTEVRVALVGAQGLLLKANPLRAVATFGALCDSLSGTAASSSPPPLPSLLRVHVHAIVVDVQGAISDEWTADAGTNTDADASEDTGIAVASARLVGVAVHDAAVAAGAAAGGARPWCRVTVRSYTQHTDGSDVSTAGPLLFTTAEEAEQVSLVT